MQNKVRQITDSMHGTIHISALEHQMMSTPFFYRLHDVYQSSTVYMTFPSNRTKRFEHSIGTMHLAGQMFYSAVNSASVEDKKTLLTELQTQFELILKLLEDREKVGHVKIYQAESNALSSLIPKAKCNINSVLKILHDTVNEAPLVDRALCQQEVCFFDLFEQDDDNAVAKISLYSFIYQCALESLRVAALFHDIGHPPFSHIIETTLQKLYKKESDRYVIEKFNKLKHCLENYIQCETSEQMLLETPSDYVMEDSALHEKIGYRILYNAYNGVFKAFIAEWGKKSNDSNSRLKTLYLITVLEFTFGILLEKAPVFASLHRIIDGPVDADRLDYIARDTHNSGVSWGAIPYNRLIGAVKFTYINGVLKIAFPEKVCDDVDDLLINRYKIFQRINYHHKSVKTSELLQRAVEMLAEDYLLSAPGKEIVPEIMNLWGFLEATLGVNEAENQISQWTDSWLISVLSNALSVLSDPDKRTDLIDDNIGRSEEHLDTLVRIIEEVQLNRKRYFPLLKRHRDALLLTNKIVSKAGITEEALDKLSTCEYNKLINETGDKADSAREALYRIELLRSEVLRVANLGLLDTLLPDFNTCQEIFEDILIEEKEAGRVNDYFLWNNVGLYKLGASDTTDITLYRKGDDVYQYDVSTCLKKKLNAQRAGCLWMFAYVCFDGLSDNQIEQGIDMIFERIATEMGQKIHDQMNNLFDFDSVMQNCK